MATIINDDSTLIRQPKSLFESAEQYQRENGAAMFWTVFIERDGRAEVAGTAYELSSGEIILPAVSANDTMHCTVREEQEMTSAGLQKSIFVERVIEHRQGPTQLKLV